MSRAIASSVGEDDELWGDFVCEPNPVFRKEEVVIGAMHLPRFDD